MGSKKGQLESRGTTKTDGMRLEQKWDGDPKGLEKGMGTVGAPVASIKRGGMPTVRDACSYQGNYMSCSHFFFF